MALASLNRLVLVARIWYFITFLQNVFLLIPCLDESLRSFKSKLSVRVKYVAYVFSLLALSLPTTLLSAELRLSWRDNSSNESGFKIERSTDGVSFSQIATVGRNARSYVDSGLQDSTRYWYKVRAFNSAGNSGYTNINSGVAATGSGGTSNPNPPSSGGGGSSGGSSSGGGGGIGSNRSPTITQIEDQTIPQGSDELSFGFTIWDAESPSSDLQITATSSVPEALNNETVVVTGISSNRKLEFGLVPSFTGAFQILLQVSDGQNEVESSFNVLVEEANFPPFVTEHPKSTTTLLGGQVSFIVSATANPQPTYQWNFNGIAIEEEIGATLSLENVTLANQGNYSVRITNTEGSVLSQVVSLDVIQPAVIEMSPSSQNALVNESVTLSVDAVGSNLGYQWYSGESGNKSNPIDGAVFSVFNTPPLLENASFWVEVFSRDSTDTSIASVESDSATIFVSNDRSSVAERLSNVSLRAQMEDEGPGLVAGFVISGTGTKRILLRALGPSLIGQGISNPVEDISISLFRLVGSSQFSFLGSNQDWWRAENASEIASISELMGAVELGAEAKDAAMLLHLPVGVYGAQLSGTAMGASTALIEIFDVDAVSGNLAGAASLSNISMRASVGEGENVVIAGFVVTGTELKQVLVRAVGTELLRQGISNPISNPLLHVFKGSELVSANDDWNDFGGVVSSVSEQVGAVELAPSSKSSALVLWLTPGIYGALASSSDGSSGIVLIEVYEVF